MAFGETGRCIAVCFSFMPLLDSDGGEVTGNEGERNATDPPYVFYHCTAYTFGFGLFVTQNKNSESVTLGNGNLWWALFTIFCQVTD